MVADEHMETTDLDLSADVKSLQSLQSNHTGRLCLTHPSVYAHTLSKGQQNDLPVRLLCCHRNTFDNDVAEMAVHTSSHKNKQHGQQSAVLSCEPIVTTIN